MERALQLSEVLEARGFGSRSAGARTRLPAHQLGWNGMLAGSCLAAYALVVGAMTYAGAGLGMAGLGAALLLIGTRAPVVRRTRYRIETRGRRDWMVIAAATASMTACVVARNTDIDLFLYEPYPTVVMPETSVWLLLCLFGLFIPAMIDSSGRRDD
jgi:hypothetical protein